MFKITTMRSNIELTGIIYQIKQLQRFLVSELDGTQILKCGGLPALALPQICTYVQASPEHVHLLPVQPLYYTCHQLPN